LPARESQYNMQRIQSASLLSGISNGIALRHWHLHRLETWLYSSTSADCNKCWVYVAWSLSLVHLHLHCLSRTSIIWYLPKGSDTLWLKKYYCGPGRKYGFMPMSPLGRLLWVLWLLDQAQLRTLTWVRD